MDDKPNSGRDSNRTMLAKSYQEMEVVESHVNTCFEGKWHKVEKED